mmetsp:Transcript_48900/g.95914  ORF Transcript_48900/g.95914 Transcript_48900/m.95914 type:complete len:219 (-) Transcript_48900:135-791(-)
MELESIEWELRGVTLHLAPANANPGRCFLRFGRLWLGGFCRCAPRVFAATFKVVRKCHLPARASNAWQRAVGSQIPTFTSCDSCYCGVDVRMALLISHCFAVLFCSFPLLLLIRRSATTAAATTTNFCIFGHATDCPHMLPHSSSRDQVTRVGLRRRRRGGWGGKRGSPQHHTLPLLKPSAERGDQMADRFSGLLFLLLLSLCSLFVRVLVAAVERLQ